MSSEAKEAYLKIPYALQDFKEIKDEGYLYVDKTKYIEILENMDKYVLFLRPRRFGKTLFTSILSYYYDVRHSGEFDKLFGGLYIGGHKTPTANAYNVLRFDFSGIMTEKDIIEAQFASCVKSYLEEFCGLHGLDIKIDGSSLKSNMMMRDFFTQYKQVTGTKLFIIIDEYDHFANDVLAEDRAFFVEMTGKDGFVRKFYEVFKSYSGSVIGRIFITGVTPITLDSLTSGFNISTNVGNDELLNEMIGFTEDEVKEVLNECGIDMSIMDVLKENYNGYLFNENAMNKVYNSTLSLYFIKEYQKNDSIPSNMIDRNVISDHRKIARLFNLYDDDNERKSIIMDIVEGKSIVSSLEDGALEFSRTNTLNERVFSVDRDGFLSLLYYLGLLTIEHGEEGLRHFVIPNKCIKDIYSRFYLQYLSDVSGMDVKPTYLELAIKKIAESNDFGDFNTMLEENLRKLANVDYERFDEKYIKVMMFAMFNISTRYMVKSEYEIEGRRPDIMLLPNHRNKANYHYMIEIKYLKKKGTTQRHIERARQDAIRQVREYEGMEEVKDIRNLIRYVMVVVKDEIKVFEEVQYSH